MHIHLDLALEAIVVCGEVTSAGRGYPHNRLVQVELDERIEGVDDDVYIVGPKFKLWLRPLRNESVCFDHSTRGRVARNQYLPMVRGVAEPDLVLWQKPVWMMKEVG